MFTAGSGALAEQALRDVALQARDGHRGHPRGERIGRYGGAVALHFPSDSR